MTVFGITMTPAEVLLGMAVIIMGWHIWDSSKQTTKLYDAYMRSQQHLYDALQELERKSKE